MRLVIAANGSGDNAFLLRHNLFAAGGRHRQGTGNVLSDNPAALQ